VKSRFKLALLALMVLVMAFYGGRLVRACGPFFPGVVFINTLHPDFPIGPYAEGNLGVIQPTYSSIYLYVAYRNLAGVPITAGEQEALWNGDPRLVGEQGPSDEREGKQAVAKPEPAPSPSSGQAGPDESPFSRYDAQPDGVFREVAMKEDGYTFSTQFLNCPRDAFRNAVSTYKERAAKFGAASPVVQSWVQAQQEVFGNCESGHAIPEPLPQDSPVLARADRAYQIAAAHFYAGDYDEAASEFRAIARDQSSPWRTIAPYLVARALVRKATMNGAFKIDLATLAQAGAQIQSVLADPALAPYRHAAERLRGFIELRLHPERRLVELSKNLMEGAGDPDLRQDVIDFKILSYRMENRADFDGPPSVSGDEYAKLADTRAKSDFLDWMFTLRLNSAEAYPHALEKWQSTHSQAWLMAALMKAAPRSPHVAELRAAAEKVPAESPAYISTTFQSLRLGLLRGETRDVRERLARLDIHHLGIPAAKNGTPPSAINQFLSLRFALAPNLDELLENASRVPAMITDPTEWGDMPLQVDDAEGEAESNRPRFDDDAVLVMNRFLPSALLAKAAESEKLPKNLRREIALVAWTRAALLDEASVARALAPRVEALQPELKDSLPAYDQAKTPGARHFVAVLVTLRFPGLRPFVMPERETPLGEIDEYRDNWWGTQGPECAFQVPEGSNMTSPPLPHWPRIGPTLQSVYAGGEVKPPAFLTTNEGAAAAHEWQRLRAMGSAPDYLSAQVIAWARGHSDDPLVPEALARAVRSTRFGCTDAKTGKYSKEAFTLLHRRYPNSTWAKSTKYWFN
jgi:hypothetical protein